MKEAIVITVFSTILALASGGSHLHGQTGVDAPDQIAASAPATPILRVAESAGRQHLPTGD